MAMHRVLYQEWESRDSWSGPESMNGSLHLDKDDRDAYIKAQYGDRSGRTPEYYILAVGDAKWVEVDEKTFAKISKNRPGIRAAADTKTTYKAV